MEEGQRLAWHGVGASIRFAPEDFEVLDLTLGQIPDLRVCAHILKKARQIELKYPVTGPRKLFKLLGNKSWSGGGYEIEAACIERFMVPQWFPLDNEGDLVSRIYLALMRCRQESHAQLVADPAVLAAQQKFDAQDQAS